MLQRITPGDSPLDERAREECWIGDVQEIGNVGFRPWCAVYDSDCPACFAESAVPGMDVALGVGVHGCVSRVPEEPDVFGACYWGWVLEVCGDCWGGTEVQVRWGDGVYPLGNWVFHDRVRSEKSV